MRKGILGLAAPGAFTQGKVIQKTLIDGERADRRSRLNITEACTTASERGRSEVNLTTPSSKAARRHVVAQADGKHSIGCSAEGETCTCVGGTYTEASLMVPRMRSGTAASDAARMRAAGAAGALQGYLCRV
ncbi:hypothetical protein FGB62_13g147 [Gracilaria domingensis]|nr:hypothetical protein FGB62_13g147 [Gracilaria domingensis]